MTMETLRSAIGLAFVGLGAWRGLEALTSKKNAEMVWSLVGVGLGVAIATGGAEAAAVWFGDWFADVVWTHPGGEAPKPHADSGSDAGALWWAVAAVGTLAAGLGVAALVASSRRRAGRRRDGELRERERWEAIAAEHDEIREAYGAFVLDVLAVLDRPALADVGVSQTVAFLCAMDAASDAERSGDPVLYREAVSRLKIAWADADANARRTGLARLGDQERAKVVKARGLLAKFLSDSGSEHERQAAFVKARQLLEGVVTIPQQTVAALTSGRWLSLAKGESTA